METLEYSPTLYAEIVAEPLDYVQIGETVCGAQDPAVIELSPAFREKHPELAEFTMVRVVDQFINCARSDTQLVFSTEGITDEERRQYELLMDELN